MSKTVARLVSIACLSAVLSATTHAQTVISNLSQAASYGASIDAPSKDPRSKLRGI